MSHDPTKSIATADNVLALRPLYADMSEGEFLWANALGEPFFDVAGEVMKISPESGDRDVVCQRADFSPDALDGYWTAAPLLAAWESIHGPLPEGHFLVPAVPFVLGGEFEASNLVSMSYERAVAFYRDVRKQIADLPDGAHVELKVSE